MIHATSLTKMVSWGHCLAPLTPPEERTGPGLCSPIAVCLLVIIRCSWEPSHPTCPASGSSSGCPKHPLPSPGPSWAAWTPPPPQSFLCHVPFPVWCLYVHWNIPCNTSSWASLGLWNMGGGQVALISLNGPDEPHLVLPTPMDLGAHFSSAVRGSTAPVLATLSWAELALAAPWKNGFQCNAYKHAEVVSAGFILCDSWFQCSSG